jgi:probable rRNA maturation factor
MSDEPGSSSLEIAVSVHDAAWLDALADLEGRAQAVVRSALRLAGDLEGAGVADARLEVSLVFTDDAEQRRLNHSYRQRDAATNVLSFPNMEEADRGAAAAASAAPRLLGDVVLARETVAREARDQDKRLEDHVAHLLVHGVLHLLGYDHQNNDEAERMEALETAILAEMGIADPYRLPLAGGLAHG